MVQKLNAQDVRQGERGRPVLVVLVASLVLLAVAAVGLLAWNGANAPKDYASRSQDASRTEVTGSVGGRPGGASSSNSTAVPGGNPAYPQPAQQDANGGTAR